MSVAVIHVSVSVPLVPVTGRGLKNIERLDFEVGVICA